MDERTLTIIKSMAMGYLAEEECWGYTCLYCTATAALVRTDVEAELEEIQHDKDCPIVLARQVLRDAGTPMNVYKMRAQRHYMTTSQGPQWREFTGYTLAISEQDAIKNYSWSSIRDLQASFVREFPLD